ncbi:phospholipase B-like protein [Heterostelium album PN500]|uniref:Phospholipase B-like n=1 Tax=Heterostelium pallidum (strain ATCC 26659 / Pp 5 / PN500) TaxID=670386 RepID=D3BBX1_HETP5|nr:phospholipase B-like protein [Heterostelium album PN500]EFA81154.1 phospholipase B-like protein [Heterostelium album PN500]|eukprot:XP_020433272.1 phospholipase B-like protein [Heterostelium album PN500]
MISLRYSLLFTIVATIHLVVAQIPSNIPVYSTKLESPTSNQFVVYPGNDSTAMAQAAYTNQMMEIGWGYISITTNPDFTDFQQAMAAGFIEGYLSADMIWQTWYNIYVNEYNNQSVPSSIIDWSDENLAYIYKQVEANTNDPFWIHISLIVTQMSSMVDGYNSANTDPSKELTMLEFYLMNSDGDMGDISYALNLTTEQYRKSLIAADGLPKEISKKDWVKRFEHCSSLIKLTDDLSELYSEVDLLIKISLAHTSWSSYYVMVRMFKSYNLKYSAFASSHLVMFSGYPATLASCDDFYLLDTRLVVTETTNGLLNNNLYNLINPQSVLTWMRAIVANRLAHNGPSWCEAFSNENSGTYNNQWMITDYNKFVKGVRVRDGTLYVLEQIPGYIEYADVTNILRTGYWPSYNVPYFENIFNMSGFNDTGSSDYEAYEEDPRSQIFRRDANKVYSMSDFQAIMRYNNFQHDPLSQGDAANQISSRFDLNLPTAQDYDAFGGIDSKVTSYHISTIWSDSTHDQQPPFQWSAANWTAEYPTIGMPNTWNFTWVTFEDTTFSVSQ